MSSQHRFLIRKGIRVWVALWVIVMLMIAIYFWQQRPRDVYAEYGMMVEDQFAGFNNENGTKDNRLIVPNIVHFIVFEKPQISFIHFICVLAALKNQKPDKIFFHTNVPEFEGIYWQRLLKLKKFKDTYVLRKIEMPISIWGQKIQPSYWVFHGGDIARIRVLMEFGGIYLDNDSYIVRSLDYFRKFEIAIGWDEGQFLGSQIIVAHKNARFLKLWLKTYDGQYDTNKWYYNAGQLPTVSILYKYPELVHRVKHLFGNDVTLIHKLFGGYWKDWRNYYTFHLLARKGHQGVLSNLTEKATYPVEFDEHNLQKYPITFREMANQLLIYEEKSAKV